MTSDTPRVRAAVLALCVASCATLTAAVPVPPKPAKYVEDRAGVFDASRAAALNEKLASFERASSTQVVVWVDRRLPSGASLEELATGMFHAWGIGQKGSSNGALFLVFVDDRKMRLEIGYGLEGAIPDVLAHRITDETVKPYFRNGDYAGGIEAGVDAILAAARGEPYKGSGTTAAERKRGIAPRQPRDPPGWLASMPDDPTKIVIFFFGVLVFVILLCYVVFRRGRHGSGGSYSSYGGGSSDWSSSSSSDSSSSSSDFSGGGGDSGGGGSSDSW